MDFEKIIKDLDEKYLITYFYRNHNIERKHNYRIKFDLDDRFYYFSYKDNSYIKIINYEHLLRIKSKIEKEVKEINDIEKNLLNFCRKNVDSNSIGFHTNNCGFNSFIIYVFSIKIFIDVYRKNGKIVFRIYIPSTRKENNFKNLSFSIDENVKKIQDKILIIFKDFLATNFINNRLYLMSNGFLSNYIEKFCSFIFSDSSENVEKIELDSSVNFDEINKIAKDFNYRKRKGIIKSEEGIYTFSSFSFEIDKDKNITVKNKELVL